ncbi:MAG TPA: O-antigen ligase family protein [Abditibacteriaceae bacterium]
MAGLWVSLRLGSLLGLPSLPYQEFLVFLPALALAVPVWINRRDFSHRLPILLCIIWPLVALLWVDPTERGRGVVVPMTLLFSALIGSAMARHKLMESGARAFIVGTLISLAGLFFISRGTLAGSQRLGSVFGEESIIVNPNVVAINLVLASYLGVYVVNCIRRRQNTVKVQYSGDLVCWLLATILCAGSVVLTGSRGGIVGMTLMFFVLLFMNGHWTARVISSRIAVLFVFLGAGYLAINYIEGIAARVSDTDKLASLSDRVPIWQAGYYVLSIDDSVIYWGVGTGGVHKRLGEEMGEGLRGADGVLRRSPHNSYLEWAMSLGLPGIVLGGWLAFTLCRRAFLLDRRELRTERMALLTYCFTHAMSTTIHTSPFSVPLFAMVMALVCQPVLFEAPEETVATNKARGRKRKKNRALHPYPAHQLPCEAFASRPWPSKQ